MRALQILAAGWLAVALAGCGGGGDMVARIGSGGSGSPVEVGIGGVGGFGSIIVHGRHYDETGAEFTLDERPDQPTPVSVDALRLGVQIQFEAQSNRMTKGTVTTEVIGPVTSIAASGITVLGQTVRIDSDPASPTVFDGFTTLAELAGATVEVHGQRNVAGEIQAGRVALRPATGVLRVAGTVTDLAGGNFRIGGLAIRGGQAAVVPAGRSIANGQRVAVWTDQALANGELPARVIRVGGPTIPNDATLTVEGVVTDFQRSASLRIGGVSVDASTAQTIGGVAADLRNGRQLRASGTYSGDVLRAFRIEFLSTAAARVELSGSVTSYSDAGSSFQVRGTATKVTPQTTYQRGDVSNLGNGVLVMIEGPLDNGVVEATTLEFLPPSAGIASVLFGIVTDPKPIAGGTSFLLYPLPFKVETTNATAFKKGNATDLTAGRGVKVDGTYDGLRFVAAGIQFMDNVQDPPSLSIDGVASNVQPGSVNVDGRSITLTPATVYNPSAAALVNGAQVAVEAVKINGQLFANSVEVKASASRAASVRGIVSGRTSDTATEFLVGSQRVSVAGNPQVIPGNRTLKDIRNGTDIEVDGTMASGLLLATRVKFR
jgi:hypothetical protein